MDTRQAAREMISRSGKSARAISAALGKSANYVGAVLAQGCQLASGTLLDIASACGYRLALIPESEELPSSAIVIDAKQ